MLLSQISALTIMALLMSATSPANAADAVGFAGGWQTSVEMAPSLPSARPSRPVARITTGALPSPAKAVPSLSGGTHALRGIASFYWQDQKTANGERFDKMAMTAAHKTLPFNTRVRVTNEANGRSVVVRINDRGPFKPGRVIDLSYAAAGEIGMRGRGLTPVRVEVLAGTASAPVVPPLSFGSRH